MELQALNFIILGILTLIFAIGLDIHNRRFLSTSVLVGIYGLGALLVAGLPCDPGCSFKGNSLVQIAHNLDALISFIVLAVAPLFFSRSSKTIPSWTKTSVWSLRVAHASILLLGAYLLITVLSLSPYLGLLQRISLGLPFAWVIMIAYKMARMPLINQGRPSP